MGNCHPEKTNVERGEAEVDIGFRGLTRVKAKEIKRRE